ncbi:MAG TPA: hypothetical protein VN030_08770 [Cellvibrio sp.]|nr:hypothetical protein [Cellvibrio sp.]
MAQSVTMVKDNKKCEVFFFARWVGYAQPVKVVEPLTYAEALTRGNYQRAWMCENESRSLSLFTRLEGFSIEGMKDLPIPVNAQLNFFSVQYSNAETPAKAHEIAIQDTFDLDEFFVDVKDPNGSNYSKLVRQKKFADFEYLYDSNGKMTKLRTTNALGVLNELDY